MTKGGTKLVEQVNYFVRTFVKSLRKIFFLAMLINSWNLKVLYLDSSGICFQHLSCILSQKKRDKKH